MNYKNTRFLKDLCQKSEVVKDVRYSEHHAKVTTLAWGQSGMLIPHEYMFGRSELPEHVVAKHFSKIRTR